MRLQDLSLNEKWSPLAKSPVELRFKVSKRSLQSNHDQEEYIKHLEKRLEELEGDAHSPSTRRPVKEKLSTANKENERLQKELTSLKERFETEVKRTVEEKIATEVELRRKVRDLEDTLEEKENQIREMQYQHEEKRLDTNVIDALKASIERLEQEKLHMEAINSSMSKRNEVLTTLVANSMSPPKVNTGIDSVSPVREKRNARPMSLILPRAPLSPNGLRYNLSSLIHSPKEYHSTDISPLKLSPLQKDGSHFALDPRKSYFAPRQEHSSFVDSVLVSPALPKQVSRRSTMHSETSASSASGYTSTSNVDEHKIPARRKPRKFMAGSTQLKPLLLPTLTGEVPLFTSASTISSPGFFPLTSTLETELDPEDTILATQQDYQSPDKTVLVEDAPASSNDDNCISEEGPGPAYNQDGVNAQENREQPLEDSAQSILETTYLGLGLSLLDQVKNCDFPPEIEDRSLSLESLELQPWNRSTESYPSQYSMQNMPIASTPDSLVAMPLPLFSPVHSRGLRPSMHSKTASESSQHQVNVMKKRRTPKVELEAQSLAQTYHYHHEDNSSKNALSEIGSSPRNEGAKTNYSSPIHEQPRRMRSSDNFTDLLRRKDFAVKPLAAVTIRSMFKILATCTAAVRETQRDPFALARRVLANAWRMNWKVLGKLSWWVLGLFIQPRSVPKARTAINWDQYDGETIASRYCCSETAEAQQQEESRSHDNMSGTTAKIESCTSNRQAQGIQTSKGPGLFRSLFLWGKFSTAIMLAIGGAVIKGPSEMMRDMTPDRGNHGQPSTQHSANKKQDPSSSARFRWPPQTPQHIPGKTAMANSGVSDGSGFASQSNSQLHSTSLLEQIQQEDNDSTLRPEQPGRGRLVSLFTPSELSLMQRATSPDSLVAEDDYNHQGFQGHSMHQQYLQNPQHNLPSTRPQSDLD